MEAVMSKCKCEGCQFISDGYQYGISITEDLEAAQGHDSIVDNRLFRLGRKNGQIPPEKFYADNPEDWVCAESRRTIALEAIRRWQQYLGEVEREIQDGGPAWRKQR